MYQKGCPNGVDSFYKVCPTEKGRPAAFWPLFADALGLPIERGQAPRWLYIASSHLGGKQNRSPLSSWRLDQRARSGSCKGLLFAAFGKGVASTGQNKTPGIGLVWWSLPQVATWSFAVLWEVVALVRIWEGFGWWITQSKYGKVGQLQGHLNCL